MKKENLHKDSDSYLAKWLEGELTDLELKSLVSHEDFLAFKKLKSGLDISERLNASTQESFSKIQAKIAQPKTKVKPLYTNWAIGIAASIVLLFGLFTFLNDNDVLVETGFGETKTIALLDGSEVILNSKSQLKYNENDWESSRRLELDGEAYFKVAKGKTFSVKTDNGTVSVLGTQFNVKSIDNYFDVVCYEGKVGVKTLESSHILLPQDAVRGEKGAIKSSKVSRNMPSWIAGESNFKSVPLHVVIKALENQYQINFDTKSIDDSDIFTGSFPHDSLSIALKTVFETLDITYSENEKRNIKLSYKK